MSSTGKWRAVGTIGLALALLPFLAAAQATASKIGYVDLKRLIDNAPQMAQSRLALQREFAPRDAALKADEARLTDLNKRYTRDAQIMTKADADALKRQIDTLDGAIKRTREALRNDLNVRAAADRDRIWQQINDTVIDYARTHGYDLVVPSPVVYANPRVDITDAVLDQLRHAKPAAGTTP
ncbi:MAG: OmpH family outer membrane protein [Proteobacteria bacterium]|nr:OmpH family outer membrane protein [Pseudomonadota bacterium]